MMNMPLVYSIIISMVIKRSYKIIITIIMNILILSFWYAQESDNLAEYITNINKIIASTSTDNERYSSSSIMISNLCTSIYNADINKINYDPKQSIFVSIVCNSLAKWIQNERLSNAIKEKSISNYLKKIDWYDMWLFCPKAQNTLQSEGNCIPEKRDNSIDYNYLFLKTIQYTLNDRSNIATVRLYGFEKLDEKNWDLANLYLATKYKAIGKTPEEKDYPKTYKEINNYISDTKTIMNKIYFINTKKVKDNTDEIASKYCLRNSMLLTVGWKKPDSTFCNKKEYSDQTSYINTLYNELFFYTLFSSFYEQYSPIFFQQINKNQEPYAIREFLTQNEKISFIQQQANDQRKQINTTTQVTIKQLWNLQASFPIHIGLLLYKEDLYKFRKNLATIYLPFHQLHYKLENVQSKE